MNKKESPNEKWNRLTKLAQEAPRAQRAEKEELLPPGLATRIAAEWAAESSGSSMLVLLERAGWYGAGIATAICLVCVTLLESPSVAAEPLAFDSLLFGTPLEVGEQSILPN